jgi:ABC-type lipoprotein export system ATPase subunit
MGGRLRSESPADFVGMRIEVTGERTITSCKEPTGSLDSRSSEQVFQILRELVDRDKKTVVAVTHDLDLAQRMDRRIRLDDGEIVSDEGTGA